jgi:hypothetical protein
MKRRNKEIEEEEDDEMEVKKKSFSRFSRFDDEIRHGK